LNRQRGRSPDNRDITRRLRKAQWHLKRIQKFVYKGEAPVTKEHQLTVWPTR
jgi:hypothetical protein